MNMKCPNCGRAKLVHGTRDMPYTYKGESTVIPAVTGDYCSACDEAVLDLAESTRTSALMLAFNREVNGAIVDPAFIASVRKKLGPQRFSGAASTPSPATRTGRPSLHWRSSSCSGCSTDTLTSSTKYVPPKGRRRSQRQMSLAPNG
jgi:putative zinc finger/helix-turn-helix YgiT family protein